MLIFLVGVLSCADPVIPAAAPPPGGARSPGPAPPGSPPPTGAERSPIIPADSPAWATMSGFVPEPSFYGEHSWADVKMRVAGHVATIGRDLARARSLQRDWAGCARAYEALVQALTRIEAEGSTATPIRDSLLTAARRDAGRCAALAGGTQHALSGAGVAGLRDAWLAGRSASELQQAASGLDLDRSDLQPDGFADFNSRHALRVRLVAAWAEVADPFYPSEPWGPWGPGELRASVEALISTAGDPDPLAPGRRLAKSRKVPEFSVDDFGALPTGDSLIDTAGFPGPKAIGELAVLNLKDPTHRAWLEAEVARLSTTPDAAVPAALDTMIEALERSPYGSRYYNIKQVRNAGVRVLASRGDPTGALKVLSRSWPLHNQDWACPNREGILRGIEGRLKLLAGAPDAEATLNEALAASERFLEQVRQAGG